MSQERKLVTVLFADIIGSTAIGRAHDPEVVRDTLGRTFERIRETLVSHGGTVEKFIGDAVMAVFGVPIAHDDDADRAVRAAFALRRAVGELNERASLALDLRIGVNTGLVVAGTGEGAQFLVTGDAVNAAARLEQAAAPGQILVGALTRQLTEGGVRYGRRRAVKAKGIGTLDSWAAEELLAATPEQRRGIAGLRAPLIGRDEEMRLLLDSHRRVATGRRPYLVTVFATAGSGKTRLTQEFVDAIGEERVRRGRCLPYGEGITFWPVQEILRADAGISATDTREEATGRLRARVLAAFGEGSEDADAVARRLAVLAGIAPVAEALPELTAESIGEELRWGLRRYLDRRAQDHPLTLIFEDIHWAESGLLDVIEQLAERSQAPLFILCLARPELLDVRPGWGGGRTNAASIALEPLTPEETRRLIAELLAVDALPDAVRAEVVTRAEGNPLYVEEFLRMLIDAGQIERRRNRWVATRAIGELVVPPTVQGLVAARLDRTPAAVKRLLLRAAVVGKVFWTSALGALLDEAPDIAAPLAEAVRRDLVVELDERGLGGGRAYRFTHIIVRDVAYAAIPKAERSSLHDRFARWLEEIAGERADEYAEIVAHHAEQAFLLARELGAAGSAELGRRAFDRVLPAAGRARERADWGAARVLYDRAAGIGRSIELGPAERAEAIGFAAVSRWSVEGSPEARAGLEGVLDELRAAGPSEVLVEALNWSAYGALSKSLDRARPLYAEAVAAARATGDPELVVRALLWSRVLPQWEGDREDHDRRTREAYELLRASGITRGLTQCLRGLAQIAFQDGRFDESLERLEEARASLAAHPSALERHFVAHSYNAFHFAMGDLEAARPWAEEHARTAREMGIRELLGRGAEKLGELLYAAGDLARSRAVLEEGVGALDPETMVGTLPELQWKLSRTCLALGDLDAARRHAEAARASVGPDDVYSQMTTRAALAAVRAAEGEPDEADVLYREALATDAGERFTVWDIRIAYARFLLERGRTIEARAQLEPTLAFFAHPLAHRRRAEIEALLRQTESAIR